MKTKLFLSLIFSIAVLFNSKAQDSKILVGAGATYSSEIENIGLQIKGVYLFTDKWEGSAAYTYVFEKDDVLRWSFIDLDAHYNFASKGAADFYGLAGLNILFWKYDFNIDTSEFGEFEELVEEMTSADGTELGFNIGVGTRLPISNALDFYSEVKYTIGEFDFFTIGAGVLYKF